MTGPMRSSTRHEGHCTLAGATGSATRDGRPLIGGTSDDPFTIRTRLLVVAPPDGARFVATQIVSRTAPSPPTST